VALVFVAHDLIRKPGSTFRDHTQRSEIVMLKWAVIFLIIALVAAVFGFTDIASASAGIAKILFGIFLVLFLGAVFIGLFVGRRLTS
jgi:uncharacterized membrane protein YtjA (UPF0391 family)